jgi:hypothetical protein
MAEVLTFRPRPQDKPEFTENYFYNYINHPATIGKATDIFRQLSDRSTYDLKLRVPFGWPSKSFKYGVLCRLQPRPEPNIKAIITSASIPNYLVDQGWDKSEALLGSAVCSIVFAETATLLEKAVKRREIDSIPETAVEPELWDEQMLLNHYKRDRVSLRIVGTAMNLLYPDMPIELDHDPDKPHHLSGLENPMPIVTATKLLSPIATKN